MGMFSWDCKGCHHPLLSAGATNETNAWMRQVVAMFKNGDRVSGEYDKCGGCGWDNGFIIPAGEGYAVRCPNRECNQRRELPAETQAALKVFFARADVIAADVKPWVDDEVNQELAPLRSARAEVKRYEEELEDAKTNAAQFPESGWGEDVTYIEGALANKRAELASIAAQFGRTP